MGGGRTKDGFVLVSVSGIVDKCRGLLHLPGPLVVVVVSRTAKKDLLIKGTVSRRIMFDSELYRVPSMDINSRFPLKSAFFLRRGGGGLILFKLCPMSVVKSYPVNVT